MAKQQPASSDLPIPFPLKGVDEAGPIADQPPLTTPSSKNARAFDPPTDRNRGAQRCGLVRFCPDQLASKSVQEIFHAVQLSGQTTPWGTGDIYVPESTTWNLVDLNGDFVYEDHPSSPSPVHGLFDQDGNLFVTQPDANGIPVVKLRPNNLNPDGRQLGGGGVNDAAPPFQAFPNFAQNIVANDPVVVDLVQLAEAAAASHNLGNFTIKTNEILCVVVARKSVVDANATMALAGVALTENGGYSGLDLKTSVFRLKPAQELSGALVITNNLVSGNIAVVAFKITQLTSSEQDQSASATGNDDAPASNPITTTQAKSVLFGFVGTQGPQGDTAGTWAAPFVAHKRIGTTGGADTDNATISTAYRILFATDTFTASKTGITSRQWYCGCINFK